MYEFLRAVVAFVFVLGVLVFIHELGHYLAARWRGVHVDVFSIGFGKPLYRWYDKLGTEWRICPIPLGGYVKPHGFEGPEEATEQKNTSWIPGKAFHEKPVGSRAIIIAAGPIFNFLLAIILFSGLFFIAGKPIMNGNPVIIKEISQNSAAAKAGLKVEDRIIKLDHLIQPNVQEVADFAGTHPGYNTQIVIQRQGKELSIPVVIGSTERNGKTIGRLGISMAEIISSTQPLSLGKSVIAATQETWVITAQTMVGLGQMITGKRSAKELGGPIRIAQLSGEVAHVSFSKLIYFMGLLSINLGLINLFPIPVLDGGRLFFYGIEAILRRPVPRKIQEWGFQLGFALIIALFLFSTYNDISQSGVIRWLTSHTH